MSTDPLLAVEATLTDDAREVWLRVAYTMYPRLEGAGVADVLEQLNSSDEFLPFVEPWWDTHGQKLAMALLCDSELLSASVRLAIVAYGASNSVPFDGLAEAVARAAAAGETSVIDLEHTKQVPQDGLYHGPDLDAAATAMGGPEKMGVCLTALNDRRERHVEAQLDELTKMTDTSEEMPEEPITQAVRDLRALISERTGEDPSPAQVTALAMRIVIGGSYSAGIEIGLNLARQRLAKARAARLHFDDAGTVEVEANWGLAAADVEMVEKVDL